MVSEIQHFRRRNVTERQVLQIVRGKSLSFVLKSGDAGRRALIKRAPDEYDALCFWCLREFSHRCGLEIMPEGSQYLSVAELWLLRWLAEGQRHTGLRSVHITDPGFRAALAKSAKVLRNVGLFLPSRTLSISVRPNDAPMKPDHSEQDENTFKSLMVARPRQGFSGLGSESPP